MKKKDLVSIIVPVYKVEKVLDRCIKSILNQSYKNIEIILVDDGSPDNCPQLCDKYKKKYKRIKVIHKENGGLASARNIGIEQAKGKYICFIDSDDYVDKEYVRKMYNEISKSNLDFVVCNYKRIYDKKIQECKVDKFKVENFITPASWNKMYKKSLFDTIKFPEGLYYEDLGAFPRLYCLGKSYKIIDDYLYNYVQNSNSIMHQTNNKIFDIYKIFEINNNYIIEKDKEILPNLEMAYIFHVIIGTSYRNARSRDFNYKSFKNIKAHSNEMFPNWSKNKQLKNLGMIYRIYLFLYKKCDYLVFMMLKLFSRYVKLYK